MGQGAPRPPGAPWRARGTRWALAGDRYPGRVYVVDGYTRSRQRVRCRIESDDEAHGRIVSIADTEFYGRARRFLQVGSQLELGVVVEEG